MNILTYVMLAVFVLLSCKLYPAQHNGQSRKRTLDYMKLQIYCSDAHSLLGLLEKFAEEARDNKYK